VTDAVVPSSLTAAGQALPAPARQPRVRRRLALIVLAMVVLVASVLVVGLHGLIAFGLLLAFSADSDEAGARRSVILTRRNLGLAAAMVAAFAWFWLWHLDLPQSTLVVIAGALIALPLALQESAGEAASKRTIVVTKRSLILALWGLVRLVTICEHHAGCARIQIMNPMLDRGGSGPPDHIVEKLQDAPSFCLVRAVT
jgi:hypothetical protein